MATESKAAREHREQVEAAPLTLFPDLELEDAAARAPKVARSQKALEITKKRAIEILDAAFGGPTWRPIIESAAESERRARFRQLYADFLRTCDAAHVLDIPVFNEDGEHVYTLIHATKNEHGYRTMKEAVASALNKAPLPEQVVAAMRAEMAVELSPIVEMLRTRLAGETVRWADDTKDRRAFSLKHFALVETPIQYFQLSELQERLKPFKQPGRTIVYAFPATSKTSG